MKNVKRKLTSRKFWLAVANFIGAVMALMSYPEDTTTKVTALIVMGGGIIAYLLAESYTDGKALEIGPESSDVIEAEAEE